MTCIACSDSKCFYMMYFTLACIAIRKSPREGAICPINCASNPELNSQQAFYYGSDCRPVPSSDISRYYYASINHMYNQYLSIGRFGGFTKINQLYIHVSMQSKFTTSVNNYHGGKFLKALLQHFCRLYNIKCANLLPC